MVEASAAASRPVIDISPDTLSFELVPNSQPGCVLSVSNSSDVTIAFKVKTTEPRRYLVRPNQGVVGPKDIEAVNVYLIEKECNQLLREGIQTPSSLGKVNDKFLVQTVALGDRESALLTSVTAAKQSEALTKIWATFNKGAIRNKKLNVRLSLTNGGAATLAAAKAAAGVGVGTQSPARQAGVAAAATAAAAAAAAAATVDAPSFASAGSQASPAGVARAAVGRGYGPRNGQGGRTGVPRGARGGGGVGGVGLDENSRVLANKYDDLVNYTANLTEERDELNANLEEAKKALQREMATRIALESKGNMLQGRKGSRSGVRPPAKQQHRRDEGGGFGLVTLSLVAAFFFLLGHWLDLASGGGAQNPTTAATAAAAAAATQQHQSAAQSDTVSKPAIPLDAAAATATVAEAGPGPISGEAGAGAGAEL
eukprot:g5873.t1